MRVLVWSASFWPNIGGVEVLGAHFVRALRARGHEVLVLVRRDTPDHAVSERFAGVPVRRVRMYQALAERDPAAIVAVTREVAEIKRSFAPDVVHLFHLGPDAVFHTRTASAVPAPSVATVHIDLPPAGAPAPLATALRSAGHVAACSDAVLADTRRLVGGIGARSSTVRNALPAVATAGAPADGPPTVVFAGRLTHQKGVDLGLEAFARLGDQDARLVVAGDGPDRAQLEAHADRLGLGGRVRFAGWVAPDEIPALMAGARLVLMPSRFEPYGLVALQAAQVGRPLAGFAVGGVPEVVEDGVTGRLVAPEDVGALAQAMRELLADPARADRLGAAGRGRAQAGWERYVDAYEELYARVRRTAGS